MNLKIFNINNCVSKLGKTVTTHIAPPKKQVTNDIFEPTQKIKKIIVPHNTFQNKLLACIEAEQNPAQKAVIYKKVFNPETKTIQKIKQTVNIAVSKDKWYTTYHLLEPQTNRELGYVTICDFEKAKNYKFSSLFMDSKLSKDYPEAEIFGPRISIEYLQNNFENEYSGIGKTADQIAIEYCIQNNINPQIVSLAEEGSLIAHYKRGRRFLGFEKENNEIKKLINDYGTDDPNEIIAKMISNTKNSEHINCDALGSLYMYMPQNIIEKYIKLIKESPILLEK